MSTLCRGFPHGAQQERHVWLQIEPWLRPVAPDCDDTGVKPGTDDVALSGEGPGGEKAFEGRCSEGPFSIEGGRFVDAMGVVIAG